MSKLQVKVLLLDIETAPMEVFCWGLFDQTIPLNMIKHRTSMLAWGAKWLGQKEIFYHDQSKRQNVRDDKQLVKKLWRLVRQADIVVCHNIQFDKKKSNARMVSNGMKPIRPYREVCTLKIARKHFKFDSNKLADLAVVLGLKLRKYSGKFAGNELFVQCLKGNKAAWKEMKIYNPRDVLVLEQIFLKLIPWDNTINFNTYQEDNENRCSCGSFVVQKEGTLSKPATKHTNAGKYQQYSCKTCGKWWRGATNLLSKIKRRDMLR